MSKRTTITDVAKAVGVSVSTVSRVLSGVTTVDAQLAQRVRTAAEELCYIPNVHAQSIRGKHQPNIGVVLPSTNDNFFSRILDGILLAAQQRKKNVIVFSCHGDSSNEITCLESAAAAGISGLIFCPTAEVSAAKLFRIFNKEFPIVIGYRRNVVSGIPHVYHDNVQGGYLAAKYLLRQGHKQIAFGASFWQRTPKKSINDMLEFMNHPNRGAYTTLDRLAGHINALEEAGIPFDPSLIFPCGYDFDSGYNSALRFFSTMRDFDSVICGNDSVAAGVLQALREQNILVPEQVSVLGYDDSVFATVARPTLTSVRQEPVRLGSYAVEMLGDLLNGKHVNDHVIDLQLTIRNSTCMKNGSIDKYTFDTT